jgi:pilus assembly protein Flp/PilA
MSCKFFVRRLGRRIRTCGTCFWHDESGQDLIEYALIAALIGLAATASVKSYANTVANLFGSLTNSMSNAV